MYIGRNILMLFACTGFLLCAQPAKSDECDVAIKDELALTAKEQKHTDQYNKLTEKDFDKPYALSTHLFCLSDQRTLQDKRRLAVRRIALEKLCGKKRLTQNCDSACWQTWLEPAAEEEQTRTCARAAKQTAWEFTTDEASRAWYHARAVRKTDPTTAAAEYKKAAALFEQVHEPLRHDRVLEEAAADADAPTVLIPWDYYSSKEGYDPLRKKRDAASCKRARAILDKYKEDKFDTQAAEKLLDFECSPRPPIEADSQKK